MKVEFTDGQRRGKVVAGVDTHSKTHWLCVLGEHGGVKLSQEFPATREGASRGSSPRWATRSTRS